MTDKKIELNRRRVLGGIVAVGAAAAAAGAGTYAAFSDSESSSGNTVQAGTLDLESPTSSGFGLTGLVPGDGVSGTVTATYSTSSSVDANVTATLSLSENDASTTPTEFTTDLSASQFAQRIDMTGEMAELRDSNGNSYDILSNTSTTTEGPDGDIYTSLDNVVGHPIPQDALSNITPGDDVTVEISGTFVSTAGNDAQGDGIDLDVTFTANQQ